MKKALILLFMFSWIGLPAQSITFNVDKVDAPSQSVGRARSGAQLALDIHREESNLISEWEPQIPANSFADDENLHFIGEDVLFQMLRQAWCQHRPVTLTPDAVWMVIAQGLTHHINEHPEEFRTKLVNHDGRKALTLRTGKDLFSGQADWEGLIGKFTSEIDKYTNDDIATTLVADFSTTGVNERIASEIVLMDAVKPYFKYEVIYVVCGIPSVTLTGNPQDWRNVLEKTKALREFGLGWWVDDLEPILEEFILASEGHPNISFWKDIVKTTRPQTIQGPSCSKKHPRLTTFDGWFLKLFPFDNDGMTPSTVTITQTVLPETVCVPFEYDIIDNSGAMPSSYGLELVAGIVGVTEDPSNFNLTPKIGWFVRTTKPQETADREKAILDSLSMISGLTYNTGSIRWGTPINWSSFRDSLPGKDICNLECKFPLERVRARHGNLLDYGWQYKLSVNLSESYFFPQYRNDGTLAVMRTGFDYAELLRRREQAALYERRNYHTPECLTQEVKTFIWQMIEDTDIGDNTDAVRLWTDKVSAELAGTDDPVPVKPDIKPFGSAIMAYLGTSKRVYPAAVHDCISPGMSMDFGLRVIFNRFDITAVSSGYTGQLCRDVVNKGVTWDRGESLSGNDLRFSLGYIALDTDWMRLTPFAGIGASLYNYQPQAWKDAGKKADIYECFNMYAGISTDVKLFRALFEAIPFNYNYGSKKNMLFEINLHPLFYITHTSFPGLPNVWSFNFGLDIGIGNWEF